jgi:hypothetical protein
MRVDTSARLHLEGLVAEAGAGSVASLLLGYTYDAGWNKLPHVDVTVLPPESVETMGRELAEYGEQLIHVLDGFAFALPLSDEEGVLQGHVLTYSAGGFSLVRASS